jgi:hypothetical protein
MADAALPALSFPVALSERERFTLAVFFSQTHRPANKAERKAMKLAYRRLRLDEIIDRMRKPGGIKVELLSDAPGVIQINDETLAWVVANLNTKESTMADSLILSDIEDRIEAIQARTYQLPEELRETHQAQA